MNVFCWSHMLFFYFTWLVDVKTQNVVIHRVSVFCSIMLMCSTVMLRNTQWFFPDTNFFIYIIFGCLPQSAVKYAAVFLKKNQ